MFMGRTKGMLFGALAGSLIASAVSFLNSQPDLVKKLRRQSQDWTGKAKNIQENLWEDLQSLSESRRIQRRKTFLKGTFLGLLLGIGSAVLLTPKSGKQLRRELTQKYKGVSDKTHDIVEMINRNGYRKQLNQLTRAFRKRKPAMRKK